MLGTDPSFDSSRPFGTAGMKLQRRRRKRRRIDKKKIEVVKEKKKELKSNLPVIPDVVLM